MATYVQRGESIDYTPSSDVSAGDVIVLGDLVAVATLDIKANVLGALATCGVFDFTKAASDGGIAVGALCYWDAAEKVAKTDCESGANKLIGIAVKAALTAETSVRIALCGGTCLKQAAAVADAAAITATDAPAGGTGAAAGAWDTANHRDAAIATINALVADVTALRTKVNALLASQRAAGQLAS